MNVLETDRLTLRWLTPDDADFILQLVNDPDWITHIGDKGIRTLAAALDYLQSGPMTMYSQYGFGLYRVARKDDDTPIGLCGLIKRPTLDDVDIGYAFLPAYRNQGYAAEAAAATLALGRVQFDLRRIVAITSLANTTSMRLLEKIGLHFERYIPTPDGQGKLTLYAIDFPSAS